MSTVDEGVETTPPSPGSGLRNLFVAGVALLIAIAGAMVAIRALRPQGSVSDCVQTTAGSRGNGRIAFLATPEPPRFGPGETPGSVFGDSWLFVINPDGSGLQRIGGEFRSLRISWSADGKQVALDYGGGEFPPRNIFILGLDDSKWTQLTDAEAWDVTPAWCPNGNTIAFASSRCCDTDESHGSNYELFLADAASGDISRLTSTSDLNEGSPAWSPDGTRLAYAARPEGPAQLWVMGRDGAQPHPILRDEITTDFPSWSRDGMQIAFVAQSDERSELAVVNADGTDRKTLVDCRRPCKWIRDAVWSPDGSAILFSEFRKATEGHDRGFLRILELSTGAIRELDIGNLSACCAAWEATLSGV